MRWLAVCLLPAALAYQPDLSVVRHVFEEALAHRRQDFGPTDARTAQAARDLGLFLRANGETASARAALTEAVRVDVAALGASAPQTLEDQFSLATVSAPAAAEPLLRKAAESADPILAGQALSTLGGLRKSAGDLPGAAAWYRRALVKAVEADGPNSTTAELILNLLLQIDRRSLGPRNSQTLDDARRLAELYRQTGRPREAAALEQQINSVPH